MSAFWRSISRPLILDVVVLASLALVAMGLATTDVLSPVGWSATTLKALYAVGAVALVVVAATQLLQRRFLISSGMVTALAGVFLAGALFGPAATAIVAMLLAASAIAGTVVTGAASPVAPAWPMAQRLSIGLALVTIAVTFLSPFRVNFPLTHLAMLALFAAPILHADIRRQLGADWADMVRPAVVPQDRTRQGWAPQGWMLLWRVAAVALALFFMLHAALPERYHDALAVHLYVASYVAAHGEWSYDPGLFVFAVIPLAADFLYAHVYLFAGEPAVKLLNYVTFLVIVALIRGAVARRYGASAGLIAALLFASMPLTLVESASSFIENPLTMWVTAAAVIILDRGRGLTLRAIAGIMIILAAAALSKVHGAIAATLLGLLATSFYLARRRRAIELLGLAGCLVVAAVTALSIYIHAYWITGNPVFPFFNNVFKSPFFQPIQFVDGRWINRFKLDLLYQATFHSDHFLEAYNGALGFSLMAFLGAGLVAAVIYRQMRWLALVFLAFICAIGFSTQYLRYFYPVLPVAFLLIGLVASLYLARPRMALVFNLAVVVVLCLNVYKLNAGGWIMASYDFRVLFDPEKAKRYEQAFVPEKSLLRLVNQLQGRSSRVLLSGVSSAAPLEGTALYTSWYSKDFSDSGAAAKSGADVEAYLHRVKPTYIVHRSPPEPSYAFHGLLDAEIGRLGRKVATMGSVTLYEVRLP
ncbi:hypothetical protein J2Y55_005206 [Bosea sp. BE125]|uniref:ArnT family glycosyltransferase n=1 Tax=Bosea sp. BE125 TaxID=2817909 RepID=UPI002860DB18|nr:hypothetical protein [Bosea sp. BE125]MDR6874173.1 hypothetical protein [Bosea sp. BE125]